MNYTEQLESKYPLNIIHFLRQRKGIDKEDSSMDIEFCKMSNSNVFGEVLAWNGLLGDYDDRIKGWIQNIYGIDLDNFQVEENLENKKVYVVYTPFNNGLMSLEAILSTEVNASNYINQNGLEDSYYKRIEVDVHD